MMAAFGLTPGAAEGRGVFPGCALYLHARRSLGLIAGVILTAAAFARTTAHKLGYAWALCLLQRYSVVSPLAFTLVLRPHQLGCLVAVPGDALRL